MIADLFGSIFIIYSVPVAVFWFVLSRSSKLVITATAGAFMWLLSAFVSGIIWIAVTPLKNDFWFLLLVSVPIQELFRYLWWKVLHKAEKGLSTLSPDGNVVITREKMSLASGIGFGIMYGVMMSCNMLDIMSGPGMIPAPGCRGYNYFFISSLIVGANVIAHIMWGVIAFRAWEERLHGEGMIQKTDWKILFVLLAHYGSSFATLNAVNDSCATVVIPIFFVLISSMIVAWTVLKVSIKMKK
eukprot:m.136178 g.136178  ORF g.136178 m.136178 type:complete len:243 (+) comp10480_c0_seq1:145-873(+)